MKNFLIFLIIIIVCAVSYNIVLAANAVDMATEGLGWSAAVGGITVDENPFIKIGRILGYVVGIASVILIIIMVYGGVTWMTAGGNSEGVQKGKSMIIQGVIGLLITMSAYSLTYFVVQRVLAGTAGASNAAIELPK